MLLETAVCVLLVTEFVTGEGDGPRRSLDETAWSWKHAFKSVHSAEGMQKHRNGRRLRGDRSIHSNRRVKKLPRELLDAETKQEPINGNAPDSGILASPSNNKARESDGTTIESLRLVNGNDFSDGIMHGSIPDLGILSPISMEEKQKIIKNKVQKLKDGAIQIRKNVRACLNDSFQTDESVKPYEQDYAVEELVRNPLHYSAEAFCSYAAPMCETCEVSDVNEDQYRLRIDCPNLPKTYQSNALYMVSKFESMCTDYNICQSCVADDENFVVDFGECTSGGDKIFGDYIMDYVDGYLDYKKDHANISEVISDMVDHMMYVGPLASFGAICSYAETASNCDTCQLTYNYDAAGYETGTYNLKMHCPNTPEENLGELQDGIASLQYYCTKYKMCTTCNVDAENSLIDMQGCSSELFRESLMNQYFHGDLTSNINNTNRYNNSRNTQVTENFESAGTPTESDISGEGLTLLHSSKETLHSPEIDLNDQNIFANENLNTKPKEPKYGALSFIQKFPSTAGITLLTLAVVSYARNLF